MKNITELWDRNSAEMRHDRQTHDFNDFLNHGIVNRTMFLGNSPYLAVELMYLAAHNWNLWSRAIKEDDFGTPAPFILYPSSSGNLIHHAYHLAKFMDKTKNDVCDYDTIFEFGGGYGSMARLFHNIGFKGEYVIYDLPIFSFLQEQYLKTIGKYGGVTCISDIADIPKDTGRTLFIGTWSLSEAPVKLRDAVLSKVDACSYLIAYQDSFDGIDNRAYFNSIMRRDRTMKWHNNTIKHISGNHYYLFNGGGGY